MSCVVAGVVAESTPAPAALHEKQRGTFDVNHAISCPEEARRCYPDAKPLCPKDNQFSPQFSSRISVGFRGVKDVFSIFLLMIMPALIVATHSEANPRQFGVYYGTRFDPELSAFDVLVLDAYSGLDLALIRKSKTIERDDGGSIDITTAIATPGSSTLRVQ